MENKIIINFGRELGAVELESNTPDLDKLIEFVIKNRVKIDIEKIKVLCDDNDFDDNGFQEIIKHSIKNFLDKIVLNEKLFNAQIDKLKNTKQE